MFEPQTYNPAGVYAISLFDWNERKRVAVVVDDYFPVDAQNNPVFARLPNHREMWMPLLETAFAKMNRGYMSMTAGHTKVYGLSCDTALVAMLGGSPHTLSWHPDNNGQVAQALRAEMKTAERPSSIA